MTEQIDAVLRSTVPRAYVRYWRALSMAIDDAGEDPPRPLVIAALLASLVPSSDGQAPVFRPMIDQAEGRTLRLDDLQVADLEIIEELASDLDDDLLRARAADVYWMLAPAAKRITYARLAIHAYLEIPLDASAWHRDGESCVLRAIDIAKRFGAAMATEAGQLYSRLVAAFNSGSASDGYWPLQIAETLLEQRMLGEDAIHVSSRLEALANEISEGPGDIRRARAYTRAAGRWARAIGDHERHLSMVVREGDLWVAEARERAESPSPSHMVAATFYQQALQTFRQVPRQQRSVLGVDERITRALTGMQESNVLGLTEMSAFESESVDISEFISAARNSVKGKEPIDALFNLTAVHPFTSYEAHRADAVQMLAEHPLQSLFGNVHFSSDGRVIHRSGGLGEPGSEGYEEAVWRQMVQAHGIRRAFVTQGLILPALRQMRAEHGMNQRIFHAIAENSPVIPRNRTSMWSRGIALGYEMDFSTAVHILAPQVENLVRQQLKVADVQTTVVDSEGLENEIGLSSLMLIPESDSVLGVDLAFEIRVLFCGPLGPNLRNEVAHGLVNDDFNLSYDNVYAWWICLRVMFLPFWSSAQPDGGEAQSDGETADPQES